MRHAKWISAYELDLWANSLDARSRLPELVRRLVHATVPAVHIEHLNFPGGEETHRPGYDGETKVKEGNAKVPVGITYWEMGANVGVSGKFEGDYEKRITKRPAGDYSEVAYVAVTPRDAHKRADFIKEVTAKGHWREVRVYDSNDLEQWLEMAPAVALWLMPYVKKQGIPELLDLSTHWENLQGRLRQKLSPDVLLVSRETTTKKLAEWAKGSAREISIRGQTPQEVIDVFTGWVQSLPANQQDRIASRAVIVDSPGTWSPLSDSTHPLYLVCGARLQIDAEKVAEAIRKGHHVLRPVTSLQGDVVVLERMDRGALARALQASELDENLAHSLAGKSGGWFSVLKRQFSSIHDDQVPAWSKPPVAGELAPLLLVSSWRDDNDADKAVVETVAGAAYTKFRPTINTWAKEPDAPIRYANGMWEFVSPIDAWVYLHPAIETNQLDDFEAAVFTVLGSDSPVLDVPADDRWKAGIQGKKVEHSGEIRTALARSLAMLATREGPQQIADTVPLEARVNRTVAKLLPKDGSWKRWATLGSLLPFLAEAAPDVVLDAVEHGLRGEVNVFKDLFAEERGGFAGRAEHTGLLWALERLAWDKRLLPRVSLALAKLAEIDPGGQWANRPHGSLREVFFSWMPHTTASLEERIGVLELLFRKNPGVAWPLLVSLLPKTHESISNNSLPEWRYWAEGWKREVSPVEYEQTIVRFIDVALAQLKLAPARWAALVKDFPTLGRKGVERFINGLEAVEIEKLAPDDRKTLWNEVRRMAAHHADYSDAQWAYPADIVARLDKVAARLAPTDAVELAMPLFSYTYGRSGSRELSWAEQEKLRKQAQGAAIRDVQAAHSLPGIVTLAERIEQPWALGTGLAEYGDAAFEAQILPGMLIESDEKKRQFAEAYASTIIFRNVAAAGARATGTWTEAQTIAWLALFPFDRTTWDLVAKYPESVQTGYWKATQRQSFDLPSADLEHAVRQLLAVRRTHSAIDLLGMSRDKPASKLKPELLLDLLERCLGTKSIERPGQLTSHHLQEMLSGLQGNAGIDPARLGALEWAMLDILDRHSMHAPKALYRMLSTQPKSFIEVLCFIYKPRNERKEDRPEPTEAEKERARKAWHLLNDWNLIPGTKPDDTIDAKELGEWVKAARDLARKEDRLVVADINIGELFSAAPADADGTWPCDAVQQVMEENDSEEIGRGFMTGVANSRGVVTKSLHEGGNQEYQLAAKYLALSEKVLLRYPKVSKLLGFVADRYAADGKRADRDAAAER